MVEPDDIELLRELAGNSSERASAALVRNQVNPVMRRTQSSDATEFGSRGFFEPLANQHIMKSIRKNASTSRIRTALAALVVCLAPAAAHCQNAPAPLGSVKEGVYYFQNRYSSLILELKGGTFRYWFTSDVKMRDEPAYPLTGRYTTNGGTVTLPHKEIYQTNWTFKTYDGKPTLWRPSALEYWDDSKKVDAYGVLYPTTRKPEEIWDNKER